MKRTLCLSRYFVFGCVAVCALPGGCGSLFMGGPGGALTTRSYDGAAQLTPVFTTAAYKSTDLNSADIYLTDLPVQRLADPGDDLSDLAGSIIHLHMFLMPVAGKTPIDDTACNATLKEVIIARGAMGIYGGGGFFAPSGDPGETSFGGTLEDATMRMVQSSNNFVDRFGPATLSGTMTGIRDTQTCQAIEARIELIQQRLPVRAPMQVDPSPPTKITVPATPTSGTSTPPAESPAMPPAVSPAVPPAK